MPDLRAVRATSGLTEAAVMRPGWEIYTHFFCGLLGDMCTQRCPGTLYIYLHYCYCIYPRQQISHDTDSPETKSQGQNRGYLWYLQIWVLRYQQLSPLLDVLGPCRQVADNINLCLCLVKIGENFTIYSVLKGYFKITWNIWGTNCHLSSWVEWMIWVFI